MEAIVTVLAILFLLVVIWIAVMPTTDFDEDEMED